MKQLKKLYVWMLNWANTKYGAIALFLIAFAESSFFPIPPDALLIALVLGAREKAVKFATICSVGSILGGMFGYGIGYFLWWDLSGNFSAIANFFFNNIPSFSVDGFLKIQELYKQYDFWIIFTAGFTPIPYKLFTIASGAFTVSMPMFLIASAVSRGARFFIVSFLLKKFGEQIKSFIDKYFDWVAIGFTVALIGGFVVIKFVL